MANNWPWPRKCPLDSSVSTAKNFFQKVLKQKIVLRQLFQNKTFFSPFLLSFTRENFCHLVTKMSSMLQLKAECCHQLHAIGTSEFRIKSHSSRYYKSFPRLDMPNIYILNINVLKNLRIIQMISFSHRSLNTTIAWLKIINFELIIQLKRTLN